MSQPPTCPNVGQGRNLMGNVMSNDWMDLFYFTLQTMLNTVEGFFGYLLIFYGIVLAFLLCLTLRTAMLQFEYILRPCLPSAKKRGYWKSDGPTDKNRYRLRWPLLSLYAVFMFCVDAILGILMSIVWPIWFPLFFGMVLVDAIQISFNWFLGRELYGKKNLPKSIKKIKHKRSIQLPPSTVNVAADAAADPQASSSSEAKKTTSGFRSILGYFFWPIQIVFYFIMEVCYEGIFKPLYQQFKFSFGRTPAANVQNHHPQQHQENNGDLVVNKNS